MYRKLEVRKLSSDFKEAAFITEVKKPEVKPNHVLVRVLYTGVNATDINITAGRYFTDGKVPFDIGFEIVGIAEKVGEECKMKEGQAVMYIGGGAFAEYKLINESDLIPIPEAKKEFIALLACGMTASLGLDKKGFMKEGDKVFITAAAGGTGHICVQYAKLRGCHVIGTTSSPEKEEFLKSIGCDRVINYKKESMDEVLKKEYPDGVDLIWETIGGSVFEMLFEHLAKKGRMVIIGGITGYKSVGFPDVKIANLPRKILMRSLSLNGFLLFDYAKFIPEYMRNMIKLVSEGKIKIKTDIGENTSEGAFSGMEGIYRGVEHLHSGKNCGKVVVPICKK